MHKIFVISFVLLITSCNSNTPVSGWGVCGNPVGSTEYQQELSLQKADGKNVELTGRVDQVRAVLDPHIVVVNNKNTILAFIGFDKDDRDFVATLNIGDTINVTGEVDGNCRILADYIVFRVEANRIIKR